MLVRIHATFLEWHLFYYDLCKGVISLDIEKQFNLVAAEYDRNRRKFIPCFDDFYGNTTKFLAANIAEPKRILDLGAGTGLLSYFWLQQFPSSEFVLVDIADDMLEIARKRFSEIDHVSCQKMDYVKNFPKGSFDAVISALSIHHLENEDKRDLFGKIYDLLPDGGLLVNYDQFCACDPKLDRWYDFYWESQLASRGLTDHDLALWQKRRKLDRECSVEQEVEMLYQSKFKTVKCVYTFQKFSVIAAIK